MMDEGEQMSEAVEYVYWDIDDWPDVAPTVILPGLWMGGLADDEYVGQPMGVVELRHGFPDDELEVEWAMRLLAQSVFGLVNWASGRTLGG